MSGGVSGGGLLGGTSAPVGGAGVSSGYAGGGVSGAAPVGLAVGSTSGTPNGGVGTVATPPEGGASLVGQPGPVATVPAHDHVSAAGGGVIDYARLLVSTAAPPAPDSPSDAFWLNPNEVA